MQKCGQSKFIVISILLHSLLLIGLVSKDGAAGNDGGKGKGTGVTQDKGQILDRQVEIEIREPVKAEVNLTKKQARKVDKKEKKDPNSGYFGIGVGMSLFTENFIMYRGKSYVGVKITQISLGNPADMAGLLPDDVIFMVDGQPISSVDKQIVGSGPDPITLMIERGGQVFSVRFNRGWIQTRKEEHEHE